jgi:hypothetical protein
VFAHCANRIPQRMRYSDAGQQLPVGTSTFKWNFLVSGPDASVALKAPKPVALNLTTINDQ